MIYATLTRGQMQQIYDIACTQWKGKIQDKMTSQAFSDIITFEEKEVNEMFAAATKDQKPVLKSLFPDHNKDNSSKINCYANVVTLLATGFSVSENLNRNERISKAKDALGKLIRIADAYNKARGVVDWKNTNQPKYYSYYSFSGSSLGYGCYYSGADCPAGVVFLDSDDLLDAQSKFKQIFLDYHMVN